MYLGTYKCIYIYSKINFSEKLRTSEIYAYEIIGKFNLPSRNNFHLFPAKVKQKTFPCDRILQPGNIFGHDIEQMNNKNLANRSNMHN